MGQGNSFQADEVRAAVRIIRECCEVGDDPRVLRKHLLRRVVPLLGLVVGIACVASNPWNSDSQFELVVESGDDRTKEPDAPHVAARARLALAVRAALADALSAVVAASTDRSCAADVLVSLMPTLDRRYCDVLAVAQVEDGASFSPGGRRLIFLLYSELRELWSLPPAVGSAADQQLSHRQRQVVSMLGSGLSEKEIASRLELSPHTIHHYVRNLYQRFSANTRIELLAALRHPRAFRPCLLPSDANERGTGTADG
jgi:DNA-binding NarL/FixJ family response regulator